MKINESSYKARLLKLYLFFSKNTFVTFRNHFFFKTTFIYCQTYFRSVYFSRNVSWEGSKTACIFKWPYIKLIELRAVWYHFYIDERVCLLFAEILAARFLLPGNDGRNGMLPAVHTNVSCGIKCFFNWVGNN